MDKTDATVYSVLFSIVAILLLWCVFGAYAKNEACQDLGYDDFTVKMNMPNCIGEKGFTFVYMDCSGLFWWEDCKATPVDVGNIRIIGGG